MSVRDVILACAVDIRRNIAGMPFPSKQSPETTVLPEAADGFEELSEEYMFRTGMPGYPDMAGLLADKTMWHGKTVAPGMTFVGLGGTMLMVNASDCFVMRVTRFDGDVMSAYSECAALENRLSKAYEFAFDENLGYLTSCLEDTGNAMHAGALLHLPALTELEKIEETRKQLEKEGFELIKLIERDDSACAFYWIGSLKTMGKTCEEVLSETLDEVKAVEKAELTAREQLVYDDPDDFADKVLRSLGVLKNARLLEYEEFIELYSDVRMGLTGGLLEGDIDALDGFAADMCPHGMFIRHGEIDERDDLVYRAGEVRAKMLSSVTRRDME